MSVQHAAHSPQPTAHSTQLTAHSPQHTTHGIDRITFFLTFERDDALRLRHY